MKISVIGSGRWGGFIAWYLDHIGHNVTVCAMPAVYEELSKTRTNGMVTFGDSITITDNYNKLCESDVIVISINSQNLSSLMQELKSYELKNKIFVLCMKGIEIGTGKRLSVIATEHADPSCRVAVWIGPGHPQEFCAGVPNCMVIDSLCEDTKKKLVKEFSSELIRFYFGQDIIGNEIGAAAKNVIGIAAGMLDGLKLSTLKGALMSRGTHEISRLIKAMGGNELSAYGLCHLGDYEATVFSTFSQNRRYGEYFVSGQQYDKLAEGYYTCKALVELSQQYNVDMPISTAVYRALYENEDPKDLMKELFTRALTFEFE
ncbi:MAG: NAD(P)-binding domain-containing protein [Clostridia bacterium]|nr:NAD(P)-binding domain-containing protein [Clostridia bacterium]